MFFCLPSVVFAFSATRTAHVCHIPRLSEVLMWAWSFADYADNLVGYFLHYCLLLDFLFLSGINALGWTTFNSPSTSTTTSVSPLNISGVKLSTFAKCVPPHFKVFDSHSLAEFQFFYSHGSFSLLISTRRANSIEINRLPIEPSFFGFARLMYGPPLM